MKKELSKSEAKTLLKCHAFAHDNINEPAQKTGFLGALRPFSGILKDDNFHEIMQCLETLKDDFKNEVIEKEVISALWTICHLGRAWALHQDGMLQSNHLITQEQVDAIESWIEMISYAVFNLLDGNDDAFEEYREYLSEHESKRGRVGR